MAFSIFSLFKKNSDDHYSPGDIDKKTIILLSMDPDYDRLNSIFTSLGHSVISVDVSGAFPSAKFYDQGQQKVREKVAAKFSSYKNDFSVLFVSTDLDTKLREVVDVANVLMLPTSLLSFEAAGEGGSVYRNYREGYDYPIVDRAYFIDKNILAEVQSRNKGPSEYCYVGMESSFNEITVNDRRLNYSEYQSVCFVENMPEEYFSWVVESCSRNNIKLFAKLDILKKADREKYVKFCTFIAIGAEYKSILESSDIKYQKDGDYFVRSNGQSILYKSLPESLYPLYNINLKSESEVLVSSYLDVVEFSSNISESTVKKKYQTLVLNLKRGDNLFGSLNFYPKLLGCDNHVIYRGGEIEGDVYASFGLPDVSVQNKIRILSKERKVPYYNIENGFLSFTGIALLNSAKSHSLLLDSKSMYFDGISGSSLEDSILFQEELSAKENERIDMLVQRISTHNLSKYNHAPQLVPILPGGNTGKVLIIDQRYGDKSIGYAGASEATFNTMLMDAHRENPNADIIVKIHPDALTGLVKGHFNKSVEEIPRVYLYAEDINPICLLKSVDSVYAVSSQMGFEALMVGKKVFVYGKAIYGGWGLTEDRIDFDRRGGERKVLNQLFKSLYIDNVPYVDPSSGNRIRIEEYLDALMASIEAGPVSSNLINIGDGAIVYNPITDQYFIEKNGNITLKTVLDLLYSLDESLNVQNVLCSLKAGGQLPRNSDLLGYMTEFYLGNIGVEELELKLKESPRLNDCFNVLKVFHGVFDNSTIIRLVEDIGHKSKSPVFLEKLLYWSLGLLAKNNHDISELTALAEFSKSLDEQSSKKLTDFSESVSI